MRKLRGVEGLVLGLVDALQLLRRVQPTVVMGVGAYVSGTVLLVASLRGIPTLILEPNAEPGLANRWLRPFVDEAACAWEETVRYFGRKGVLTGNPVRGAISFVSPLGPQTREKMRVLVFGGSQGSSVLNGALMASLPALAGSSGRLSFLHQTGPNDLTSVGEAYARLRFEAEAVPYIEAMDRAYEGADLVVSRAGATTCAELAIAGRPAILVPLSLAGGHQERNAEMMAEAGAARFVRERELASGRLASEILDLLEAPAERERMAERALSLARPGAAENVALRLLRLFEARNGAPS